MTPRGRLRKAVKLLDDVDDWNDRTDRLPAYVRDTLDTARGLVAVTLADIPAAARTKKKHGVRR